MRRLDEVLGRLASAVGDDAWDRTNVIVVSDHGMATISRERIVYLGDDPCGLDFSNVAISGGNVVMGVWGRDAETGEPTADAEAAAGGFDPAAIVARVDACHPNVKAYAKDDVPDRYKYKENVRIAPVIIAADVGWTLCGYESWAGEGDGPGGGGAKRERSVELGGDARRVSRDAGAFYLTLVPIRPRSRGERRFLRTFPGVSLRAPLAFNPRPRRLSTPTDAYELYPDVALYGTALSAGSTAAWTSAARTDTTTPRERCARCSWREVPRSEATA